VNRISMWRFVVVLSCAFGWAVVTSEASPNDPASPISVRISTEKTHLRPGQDVHLHVEVWNDGTHDVFISKEIASDVSNAIARIDLALYYGTSVDKPTLTIVADSFSSERTSYPPLLNELPRYWIAIPPQHYYGGDIVMSASSFKKLRTPGKYRIQGRYRSRGFLTRDINNPLLHYEEELKQLPYPAWVGEVETNSIWIEITKR
jgi:hypothetical protein